MNASEKLLLDWWAWAFAQGCIAFIALALLDDGDQ